MITKVNDTVFDGLNPPITDLDIVNADLTDGTVTTDATGGKQLVNHDTMVAALTLAVPAGVTVPFAGTSAPTGWLLCDGGSKLAATYPNLFGVIGYTYGGAGPSFNVPDLRGRVVGGTGGFTAGGPNRVTSPSANNLGDVYGDEDIALSIAQLPPHDHSVSAITLTAGNHGHTGSTNFTGSHIHGGVVVIGGGPYDTSGGLGNNGSTAAAGDHFHTVTINPAGNHAHTVNVTESSIGGGATHSNVQPMMSMNFIIKAI